MVLIECLSQRQQILRFHCTCQPNYKKTIECAVPVNKTHTINDPGNLVGPKSYGFGTEEVEERGGQGGREEEVVGET